MYKPFNIQFGGGLNNKDSDFDIEDSQASDMQNILYDQYKKPQTRPGYDLDGDDTGANAILALFEYQYDNGSGTITRSRYRASNTIIEKDVSGSWTSVRTGLTAGLKGEAVQALNSIYYFNGTDTVQKLNNTTWSAVAGIPKGKFAVWHDRMLFVAGIDATPYTVKISGDANNSLDTPEDFTGGWGLDAGKNGVYGKITGMNVVNGKVVVYTERGIHVISGKIPEQMSIDEKSRGIGAVSHRSIASDGSYNYFQAFDGHVYCFDGNYPYKISDVIQGTISGINMGKLAESNAAVFDYKGNKYILNFAEGASNTPNRTIVLEIEKSNLFDRNYKTKSWLYWKGLNSSVMLNSLVNGMPELYFGEATGNTVTYQMFSGTNDNGTAIDAYYISKNFDHNNRERDKKAKYLHITCQAVGDWNLNLHYAVDGGEFSSTSPAYINLLAQGATIPFNLDDPDEAVLGDGFLPTEGAVMIPANYRFIKIKFNNNTLDQYFRVYSMTLYYRIGKLRRRINIT